MVDFVVHCFVLVCFLPVVRSKDGKDYAAEHDPAVNKPRLCVEAGLNLVQLFLIHTAGS